MERAAGREDVLRAVKAEQRAVEAEKEERRRLVAMSNRCFAIACGTSQTSCERAYCMS